MRDSCKPPPGTLFWAVFYERGCQEKTSPCPAVRVLLRQPAPTAPAGVTKSRLGFATDCDHALSAGCHHPSLRCRAKCRPVFYLRPQAAGGLRLRLPLVIRGGIALQQRPAHGAAYTTRRYSAPNLIGADTAHGSHAATLAGRANSCGFLHPLAGVEAPAALPHG
jgi:hypothetical protein